MRTLPLVPASVHGGGAAVGVLSGVELRWSAEVVAAAGGLMSSASEIVPGGLLSSLGLSLTESLPDRTLLTEACNLKDTPEMLCTLGAFSSTG